MVPVNYRKSDTAPSEGLIYFRRPRNRLGTTIRYSALKNRAWVIQERDPRPPGAYVRQKPGLLGVQRNAGWRRRTAG